MNIKIAQYIEAHQDTWAPSTIKSEAKRLEAMAAYLNGNPAKLWKFLKETYAEYSCVTYWTRATQFWSWAHPGEPNPYAEYRKTKLGRIFGVAYSRKAAEMSFETAQKKIEEIKDPSVRAKCLELLSSGTRWTESGTLTDKGEVVGKGGRRRKVFGTPSKSDATYFQVYRALKQVGLNPHMLRKIFGTEMVKRGANPYQLMKIMGWTNLNTAQSYIEASDSDIEKLVKG